MSNGDDTSSSKPPVMNRLFSADEPPSLEELDRLCSQNTSSETYPLASSIQENIPIYDLSRIAGNNDGVSATTVAQLQDEWYHVLYEGPGVLILKGMYGAERYGEVLEASSTTFQRIIERERDDHHGAGSKKPGDHFAGSGANERIWNSFSKHALLDPASFIEYYSNAWLARVCEAWLGPAYRITAQVNVVKPGGAPQNSHRDYHLGFQTVERGAMFPQHMHVASQLLTLQGAVAHTDMPLASGPTRLLPFSQRFRPGFLAYRRPEFQDYFLRRYVSVALEKGDGLFFSPALFHAAGANQTADVQRTANLLQVSSAFGKPMESIDTIPIVDRCWDLMLAKYKKAGLTLSSSSSLSYLIQALAEGYPFPTNLDNRPPAPSGMAPESEQELIQRGLTAAWTRERVVSELRQMKLDSEDRSSSLFH